MAVPNRKTPKAKSRTRRASAWRVSAPARSVCPHCHQTKLPHVICPGNVGQPETLAEVIERLAA